MTEVSKESNDDVRSPEGRLNQARDRVDLAIGRATAADAWRSHVESTALINRQRAVQLEHEANRLRDQADRVQHQVDQLNRMLAAEQEASGHANAQVEQLRQVVSDLDAHIADLLERPSLRHAVLQRLRRSPLGPVLRRVKRLFVPLRDLNDNPSETLEAEPRAPAQTEPAGTPLGPLPEGFCGERYFELNPGLADSGMDAADHYTRYGYFEDRLWQLPQFELARDASLDSTRPTLLFITAQADDTQSGQNVLQLANALSRYSNVLIWHMGTGPLVGQFKQSATGFLAHESSRHNYDLARTILGGLCHQIGQIDFAIVAGAACKSTLPALAGRYIPALTLLHDEAVYVQSVYFWQEIFFWSTHSCFTTPQAREQALKICSYMNPASVSVLVPAGSGQMSAGSSSHDDSATQALRDYRLQWDDGPEADGVVVGWGAADYVSGLDLFVSCADVIRRMVPDRCYRFVWFAQPGDGHDDSAYPFVIQEQIQRCRLADRVDIIYESVPASVALSMADLLMLPARAEVVQHLAVDALSCGVPVVAFAGATMTADTVQDAGFGADCLVEYGNVHAMAKKAIAMLQDKASRAALGRRLGGADWSALTYDAYAQALLGRCDKLTQQVGQERRDEATIIASEKLQPDFMGEIVHYTAKQDCSDARLYVKGWKAGVGARKPLPGFHPASYALARLGPHTSEDPFAAYLRDGCPEGPWSYPVIRPATSPVTANTGMRVALHVHAYYPDMLTEIMHRLGENVSRPDLFVSVRDTESKASVERILGGYDGKVAAIEGVPNRGRDIGPFLTTFGSLLADQYDLIGHVHTKRSSHADRLVVDMWRNFLLENLLGGKKGGAMVDTIISEMSNHEDWGIAFPDDPLPLGWDGNLLCAEPLARQMKVGELPSHFNFPAGTMFWIRSAALQPFVDLALQYDDYPQEPLPIDGSFLHALERLFGIVPRSIGMECALISVPGMTR